MTQEQDEREFEELWNLTDEEEFSHNSYEYRVGKHYWLASRRSLREEMSQKMKDIITDLKKNNLIIEKLNKQFREKELEDDLKLNATMLAKQTDLAREAEIRVKELEARNKELVEGIEKHYRGNKISCVESDGSISTVKCRGLEELYKLVEKESK